MVLNQKSGGRVFAARNKTDEANQRNIVHSLIIPSNTNMVYILKPAHLEQDCVVLRVKEQTVVYVLLAVICIIIDADTDVVIV